MKKILLALAATLALTAQASDNFPEKAVNVIVPFPAGGSTDMVARAIALSMGEQLGKSFVVENRPGATGTIGAGAVKRAPANGYTLLVASL
ncbi:MAG: tripartite tricarboxylate transporter substrate binding protein, partial [Comamonas sp.]|nr:tripartite tricarboxylate transporter substrate binding protein [Comamonas sp.]